MNKEMLVIEKIPLQSINDKEHNVNNIWRSGKPDDYHDMLKKTFTKHWIDKFHDDYKKIIIPKSELAWMKKAAESSRLTMRFPEIYREDFIDYVNSLGDVFNGKSYFVRAENVSLKTGSLGNKPYDNMKDVIMSAITSRYGHSPFDEDIDEQAFYLLPWKTIEFSREFRLFIKKGKLAALSQQNLYKPNLIQDEDELKKMYLTIENYVPVITKKIDHLDSFVVDIAVIDDVPYFIEINPYGKEYSSGSALFHWDFFDNDSEDCYMRITTN